MADLIKLMDSTFARGGIIPKAPENIIIKY